MPQTVQKPLTPEVITQLCDELGENTRVKVFCIDGVLVYVLLRKALERLPYDVMMMQSTMDMAIKLQNVQDVAFLTPMTSDMAIRELDAVKGENINKGTVNAVASMFGHGPVFGEDEDGILRP